MTSYTTIEQALLMAHAKCIYYIHAVTLHEKSVKSQEFLNSLLVFEQSCLAISDDNKAILINQYAHILQSLKSVVQDVKTRESRGIYHRLFQQLLSLNVLTLRTTRIFNDFVKGITYFYSQQNLNANALIYHRPESCGPFGQAGQNELRCKNERLSEHEMNRRKNKVFTCYLERLIYDELYTREELSDSNQHVDGFSESTQNSGHQNALKIMKTFYESCFPGSTLKIQIDYGIRGLPEVLNTIITNRGVLHTETFQRSLFCNPVTDVVTYSPMVVCSKIDGSSTFKKIQDFLQENPWKLQKTQSLQRLKVYLIIK